MLGTFTVTNGRITVSLSATGANGDIVADAVLLVPSMDMVMDMNAPARVAPAPAMPQMPGDPGSSTSTTVQASPSVSPSNQGPTPSVNAAALAPVAQATATGLTQPASSPAPSATGSSSIPAAGLSALSPVVQAITVKYAPDSSDSKVAHEPATKKSLRLSKHVSRKVAMKHQPVRESLIGRIARERVSSNKTTGKHHAAK
jgi:hypothetical protein